MKYLIDTNICIYFLKGKFDLVNKFDQVGFDNLYISEITIAELKYGIAKSVNPEKTKISIDRLINKFKHIPIYYSLDVFAEEKARLKKEGKPVDDFDLLIGATAITNDMTLVTNNVKHFERLTNITIENWTLESESN